MYEKRGQPLLTRARFLQRVAWHAFGAVVLLGISLLIGMSGYMGLEHLSATDAYLNASMLLGGMGPVDVPRSEAGKLFAGSYALYAGLVFVVAAGLVVAPVAHRLLHRFHWADDRDVP